MPNPYDRKLLSLGMSTLLSIGCGCAFLEWLLNQATSIKVSSLIRASDIFETQA